LSNIVIHEQCKPDYMCLNLFGAVVSSATDSTASGCTFDGLCLLGPAQAIEKLWKLTNWINNWATSFRHYNCSWYIHFGIVYQTCHSSGASTMRSSQTVDLFRYNHTGSTNQYHRLTKTLSPFKMADSMKTNRGSENAVNIALKNYQKDTN
jgi:hypothetical protein